jgi:hypothetical protein
VTGLWSRAWSNGRNHLRSLPLGNHYYLLGSSFRGHRPRDMSVLKQRAMSVPRPHRLLIKTRRQAPLQLRLRLGPRGSAGPTPVFTAHPGTTRRASIRRGERGIPGHEPRLVTNIHFNYQALYLSYTIVLPVLLSPPPRQLLTESEQQNMVL